MDFKRHDKTRFTSDNFIETIDFDYLEIEVIEEFVMKAGRHRMLVSACFMKITS